MEQLTGIEYRSSSLSSLASSTFSLGGTPKEGIRWGKQYERRLENQDPLLPVVGQEMSRILTYLKIFVEHNETILISGDTGVGKSRLALWCHENSVRKNGPLEVLDLSTIPEEMQMAELFGWKKGAFTSAISDHQGAIFRAEKGTLFIDEINKLSLKAQAGLLQLLESNRFRPLGDSSPTQKADIRFIIGTNIPLKILVERGAFREDLYYRINVLPIDIPSLDQRKDEIADWADFMAKRKHREVQPHGQCELTPEVRDYLIRLRWPGNLRQLDNIIRRTYLFSLMEPLGKNGARYLNLPNLHRALAFEKSTEASSEISRIELKLKESADAFVDHAIEKYRDSDPLDLKLTNCFRSMVLSRAFHHFKDKKQVYQLFGKEKSIANRTYHREFNQEMEKLNQILEKLNDPNVETQTE